MSTYLQKQTQFVETNEFIEIILFSITQSKINFSLKVHTESRNE